MESPTCSIGRAAMGGVFGSSELARRGTRPWAGRRRRGRLSTCHGDECFVPVLLKFSGRIGRMWPLRRG